MAFCFLCKKFPLRITEMFSGLVSKAFFLPLSCCCTDLTTPACHRDSSCSLFILPLPFTIYHYHLLFTITIYCSPLLFNITIYYSPLPFVIYHYHLLFTITIYHYNLIFTITIYHIQLSLLFTITMYYSPFTICRTVVGCQCNNYSV